MTRIVTIVGARPQFIKAAALSREIHYGYAGAISEVLIHTGQHYDENMSKVFFDELEIPEPKYNLEISGGYHGAMTGRMLEGVEKVLLEERPDWVLVYGDTNSTLAGALAAAKLHIPVAHVEAGLRSFNMRMPEEVNRIVADRVSTLLFCPTETAVVNLANEGLASGVENVGDVMYDVALFYGEQAKLKSTILSQLGLAGCRFGLATCHRAENTDCPERLRAIVSALKDIADILPVVFPIHPRTRKLLFEGGLDAKLGNVMLTEPLSFLDMIALEQAAKVIFTDSGGVQKEAFFYGVPCITMRDETEWVETVDLGWNQLVGASVERIRGAYELCSNKEMPTAHSLPYGDGRAASKILAHILNHSKH